jgi:predicted RNA binding protein YcfA (HicA-like mRNA interferase family)
VSNLKYRKVRGNRVNATARDLEAILRRWGFVLARKSGGHWQYQHPDHAGTVTLRAPGRPSEEVIFTTVEQAAAILGLGPLEFLNGTPPAETERRRRAAAVEAPPPPPPPPQEEPVMPAAAEFARPAHQPRWGSGPGAPRLERLLAWAEAHGEPFTLDDICVALDMAADRQAVSAALRKAAMHPEWSGLVVLEAGAGRKHPPTYGYDASLITKPPPETRRSPAKPAPPEPEPPRVSPPIVPADESVFEPNIITYPLPTRTTETVERFGRTVIVVVGRNEAGEQIAVLGSGQVVRLVPL